MEILLLLLAGFIGYEVVASQQAKQRTIAGNTKLSPSDWVVISPDLPPANAFFKFDPPSSMADRLGMHVGQHLLMVLELPKNQTSANFAPNEKDPLVLAEGIVQSATVNSLSGFPVWTYIVSFSRIRNINSNWSPLDPQPTTNLQFRLTNDLVGRVGPQDNGPVPSSIGAP